MKRTWKIAIAVAGVLLLALVVGGAALASGMHDGFVKRRVTRHIDAALDAAGVSPAQRNAVHAARDHVFATFEASAQARQADLQAALALWQADRLDPAQLAQLRAHHQAESKQIGDAVVQALSDAHDALTAPERQKLADYVRANHSSHDGKMAEGMKAFGQHMVNERVEDLLDQIHATADQRATVRAAVQRGVAAVTETMGDHGADLDQALTLFTADKVDSAKVAAMQAARQARMQKVGDVIVQALGEVHDALDAGQRKQVADFVRAHHGAGHGYGHGG